MTPGALPQPLEDWFRRRTFRGYPSAADVAAAARAAGTTISVCLPALDEEATIGGICSTISTSLVGGSRLVDELIVVDSGSTDRTVAEARAGGARVVAAADVLSGSVPDVPQGKGEVLWKSLAVARGDVVVWLDSDTRNFGPHFVTNLVAPLVADESILLCKGFYRRPPAAGAGGGGGRVTELTARPLLGALFPELAGVVQPLSGEYAGRARALRSLPMFTGYAVETGLLVDLVGRFGLDALGQADLGARVHRNRDVIALGRTASEIVRAILLRAEDAGRIKTSEGVESLFLQFDQRTGEPRSPATPAPLTQRPPMEEVLRAR